MEDFCTQKSSYFYHKILSKTQKLCTFLTSTDFKAFLYVNPLININNSKTNQYICILATFLFYSHFGTFFGVSCRVPSLKASNWPKLRNPGPI